MANYQETTAEGTMWKRANSITIDNTYNQVPTILFAQEKLVTIGGDVVKHPTRACGAVFDPVNGVIELLDMTTNLPTGETLTHAKFSQILHSLYIATATAQDAEDAAAQGGGNA